jgi:hypothetical protein
LTADGARPIQATLPGQTLRFNASYFALLALPPASSPLAYDNPRQKPLVFLRTPRANTPLTWCDHLQSWFCARSCIRSLEKSGRGEHFRRRKRTTRKNGADKKAECPSFSLCHGVPEGLPPPAEGELAISTTNLQCLVYRPLPCPYRYVGDARTNVSTGVVDDITLNSTQ